MAARPRSRNAVASARASRVSCCWLKQSGHALKACREDAFYTGQANVGASVVSAQICHPSVLAAVATEEDGDEDMAGAEDDSDDDEAEREVGGDVCCATNFVEFGHSRLLIWLQHAATQCRVSQ